MKTLQSSEHLCELAAEYGTPMFVYDTSVMEQKLLQMQEAFSFPHRIYFSCKASGNLEVLRYFQSAGCGLDTVSINQVLFGLDVGFSPKDILFTPSGSTFNHILTAHKQGVQINFDNLEHLEAFAQMHADTPVFIRFNPNIIAGGSANVSVGHEESKFGIHVGQLPHLLKIVNTYQIKVIGIHVHTGSDIIDVNQFIESSKVLFNLCKHFPHLQFVNLGSGFKVKYKEDDIETDLKAIGKKLAEEVERINKRLQKQLTLIFEPGKFLVSEAGVLLVGVNLVKHTPSATFVFVDSGFNHLIRPMYYNAYHSIENITAKHTKTKLYNIVGNLGETDTLGWNRRLKTVEEGQVLAIRNAGAYGYSMASNYNSRGRPPEVIIHKGETYLVTKREQREDLLHLYQNKTINFS